MGKLIKTTTKGKNAAAAAAVATTVRHANKKTELAARIKKSSLLKMAKRAGIASMRSSSYPLLNDLLCNAMRSTVSTAELYMRHCNRQILTEEDVRHAFKQRGIRVYGGGSARK